MSSDSLFFFFFFFLHEVLVKVLQEEGWVVCRAFKKRITGQTKNVEGWDSSYFYDESSGVSSVIDPLDYITRQPQNFLAGQNFLCKQEIEADNLSFMQSDSFVQLPQLESPSLPLIKRPSSSMSLISENNEEEILEQTKGCNNGAKKVTDWRALDKFVASQLSQDQERFEGDGESNFGTHEDSDMAALLLLQSSNTSIRDHDEGSRLMNGLLNPSSDCDIGICIFEK